MIWICWTAFKRASEPHCSGATVTSGEVVSGDGGTGKSVFLNTVAKALGDYAGAMPPSVLASKGNDHPTGLAGVVDSVSWWSLKCRAECGKRRP